MPFFRDMFGHYPYILPQHHVALESAVRNHSVNTTVTAQLLAKLYNLALEGLTKAVQAEGFYTSSLRSSNIMLSSVTEAKTGLWLQLAKVENQPQPYLTLGQKWAMEQLMPAQGNVQTVFWT
jgi:hypothetical protein